MFKPLNNRVLIKPDASKLQQAAASVGILVDDDKEKPVTGVVIVGGETVKKGDKVLFSKFGFDEVELDSETFYVVSELNLLAIL